MSLRTVFLIIAAALLAFLPAFSQNYVGSYSCGYNCHPELYDDWKASGHGISLYSISGSAPEYPFQYHTGAPNVPQPPFAFGSQLSWDDVSYVIGGYRYKANFVDNNGYIITGSVSDDTQWNVETETWSDYHPGDEVPFDCASCHTMGFNPEGHQGGMPGIAGSWVEDDVGCETCHGPNT